MLSFIARYLYSPIMLVLGIMAIPVMLCKKRGRMRILERFGIYAPRFLNSESKIWIWFHGASQGELTGFLPLMAGLREQHPEVKILLSATSPSALQAVSLADKTLVFPLDVGFLHRRILKGFRIKLIVFGEAEVWPAWMTEIGLLQIPCFLVNARMSERSAKRYRACASLLKKLLGNITKVFVSDAESFARWKEFLPEGTPCRLLGNTKYDRKPGVQSEEERQAIRKNIGLLEDDRAVFTLASLWPGEEDLWLPALQDVFDQQEKLYCIVAPRHAERFSFFLSRLEEFKIPYAKRSEGGKLSSETPLLFLDTLGELESLFSVSDAAFIGATWVEKGGHNPLEAAAYACCPALGPHGWNLISLRRSLAAKNAYVCISSPEEAKAFLARLLKRDPEIASCGKRAQEIWKENQGSTIVLLAEIAEVLRPKALQTGELRQ